MKRDAVVWSAGAVMLWVLVWACASVNAYADDRGGQPHIHVRGKLTSADGRPFVPPSDTVQVDIEPGFIPGLGPACHSEADQRPDGRLGNSRHAVRVDRNDGSYELVVNLRSSDTKRAGCESFMSGQQNIAVDRSKLRWNIPGATVSPR